MLRTSCCEIVRRTKSFLQKVSVQRLKIPCKEIVLTTKTPCHRFPAGRSMKRLQFCLVVFAVLALTFSAFAQVQNGQFDGTVTDPTGAAIANAKVTVSNSATGLSLSATTNSSGAYTVKEVPPGTYTIT